MTVLEDKITEMTEKISDLTPGSDECLNQAKAVGEIVKANAEDKKVALESKFKKIEVVFLGVGAVATALSAAGNFLTPVFRRLSNKDWIKAEDKGFYVQNKDNR